VSKFSGSVSSSCTFWSLASHGEGFYTAPGDDELYLIIPGNRLADVVSQLTVIDAANHELASYHRERKAALTS
jgi:hypothetical protein